MLRHENFYMKGGKRPFAVFCTEVFSVDGADLCSRGECKCRNYSCAPHRNFCSAAIYSKPAIQSGISGWNPNYPFWTGSFRGGCFLPLAASVDHKTLVRLTGTIADGLLLNLKYYFLGIPVCHSHQQGRGDTERFRA
jgi:hypothetical protein